MEPYCVPGTVQGSREQDLVYKVLTVLVEETDILTNKYNTMVRCSERTNALSIMKAQGTVSNPLWVGVWGGLSRRDR